MALRGIVVSFLLLGVASAQQRQGGPGQFAGELRDKQGAMMKVIMNAPQRPPPGRSLALLLVHHGMNGNEGNYFGGTMEALKRLKLDQEFVVIAGKSKGPGWTLDDDGPLTIRVIDWAKQTYPVDPRQVYIWGSSNGAAYIGRFGWAHQDLVAAAIGYCGGYNFPKADGMPGDGKTEWYFVHGGNDNPQNSANAGKQLAAMGYRYVFRQLDGYGHTDIWDGQGHPDMTLVDACRDDYLLWLRALKHKEIEPEKRDKEWLAKFENPSTAESLVGSKGNFLNLERIGGLQASAGILAGLKSKNANARANAAESCTRTSFGKAVCEELAKLVHDESDRVAQNAIRALGSYATWHYPEAIEALCKAALGEKPEGSEKGPSVGERLLAVEGLSQASRLASYGNFEDKSLWRTLVKLLEDDEVKLRASAFAALQRCVKDGHGYQPGAVADARKGALAKWQAWVQQKCGAPDAK
jgi:hypothetical protein